MTPRDVNLVRFVTERQFDLRGLREVVFAAFICVAISLIVWRREIGAPAWVAYLAIYIAVQDFLLQFIDRRYDSIYGRVNPTDGQPARSRWARTTTAQSLLASGAVLDIFTPWFPAAGVSAFLIVIALHGLWIACRDFPWRVRHLAGVAVLALAPAVDDPSRMSSFLPAYFAGASCLILTGLVDHLRLARLMMWLRRQSGAETCAATRSSA